MVREIRGAKINPKSSFKNQGAQNTRGAEITRANKVTHQHSPRSTLSCEYIHAKPQTRLHEKTQNCKRNLQFLRP